MMSKEIWKDQEAYDVVFKHFDNCNCQDGKFPVRSALDHIYKALKRNEPIEPKYEKDGTRSCPTCNANWLTPNFKFCSDCGQKLDWSDKE